MIDIVSKEEMREFDKYTIDNFVPSTTLMYRAAMGVFNSYDYQSKKVYIIVGSGNNGGDGLALANILLDNNITPYVFLIKEELKGDPLFYLDKLKERNFKNIFNVEDCDYNCDVIVDAILGTGFSGIVKEEVSLVIEKINTSNAFVISVDIQSGLDSDNGILTKAVKADLTVAIQYYKYGHFLNDGKDLSKEYKVVDIGINKTKEVAKIIEDEDVTFPKRLNNTSKHTYGSSLIIGGSKNYIGALKLADMGVAALRAGAGLNTIATINSLKDGLYKHLVESTFYRLTEIDGHIKFDSSEIDNLISFKSAIAIGMGLGNNYSENKKLIEYILSNFKGPIVLDADAINTFKKDNLSLKNKNIIITPHIKEFARITGILEEKILLNPVKFAKDFAKEWGITVLLKGPSSIITDGKQIFVVTNGSPALSKGGSGDTLSGVILGLLSQGYSNIKAAYYGAFLCAKAARKAEEEYSSYGVLASDVAKEISKLIKY